MSVKMYPPQLEGALPAFYKEYDEDGQLKSINLMIQFGANRAVSMLEVKGIALKLRTASTNNYIINDYIVKYDFSIDNYTILFPLNYKDNPEIEKINESQYYRLQIAFVDKDDIIGYYSTVGIIKCVAKPTVKIEGFDDDKVNSLKEEILGVYQQNTSFGDSTEKVYSYIFNLWDKNDNLIITSNEQIHDVTQDTESDSSKDTLKIFDELKEGQIYKIQYSVTTINGINLSTKKYKIIKPISIKTYCPMKMYAVMNYENGFIDLQLEADLSERQREIERKRIVLINTEYDSSKKYYKLNKNTLDYEEYIYTDDDEWNSLIKLGLIYTTEVNTTGKVNYSGTFLITRASDQDNYSKWEELMRFSLNNANPSDYHFCDFTVMQGVSYKYAIQQYNIYGIYSTKTYLTDKETQENNASIRADFEDMFLFDGERQLKIKYNPKMSKFSETVSEQKVETMGSKYPFVFRNGIINYKEFQISGLISYRTIENLLVTYQTKENYDLDSDNPQFFLKKGYYDRKLQTIVENELEFADLVERNQHRIFTNREDIKVQLKYVPVVDIHNKIIGYKTIDESYYGEITAQPSGENNNYNNIRTIKSKSNLTSDNINSERYFKLKVLEWLNNGEVKLFRSPTEGNYLVRLLKTSLKPEKKLGRMLHTFTSNACEIADLTYDNLVLYQILRPKVPSILEEQWDTIYFGNNINQAEEYEITSLLRTKEIKTLNLIDFAPGDKIKIVCKRPVDLINEYIIGATGSLNLDLSNYYIEKIFISFNDDINYHDFGRLFTYSFIGQILTEFDTISDIKAETQIAEYFVGPKENLLDPYILQTKDNKSQSVQSIKQHLDDNDRLCYKINNEIEKITPINIEILTIEKRQLIPIFAYSSVIDENTLYGFTPFNQGYVNNKNILNFINDNQEVNYTNNYLTIEPYEVHGGINIYDLCNILNKDLNNTYQSQIDYCSILKTFVFDTEEQKWIPILEGQYQYFDTYTKKWWNEDQKYDPSFSLQDINKNANIVNCIQINSRSSYNQQDGYYYFYYDLDTQSYKQFVFTTERDLINKIEGKKIYRICKQSPSAKAIQQVLSNQFINIYSEVTYNDIYDENNNYFFYDVENDNFNFYNDFSFEAWNQNLLNKKIYIANSLNIIADNSINLNELNKITLTNLGELDYLHLGNGVIAYITMQLRVVDYDIENNILDVKNKKDAYLQSKNNFYETLEKIFIDGISIRQAKEDYQKLQEQQDYISEQIGLYSASLSALPNVLSLTQEEIIAQKGKLFYDVHQKIGNILNILSDFQVPVSLIDGGNEITPLFKEIIYNKASESPENNYTDRSPDDRTLYLHLLENYDPDIVNTFNYINIEQHNAIINNYETELNDIENQIKEIQYKIGVLNGNYSNLDNEGKFEEQTVAYYQDQIEQVNKKISALEDTYLKDIRKAIGSFLNIIFSNQAYDELLWESDNFLIEESKLLKELINKYLNNDIQLETINNKKEALLQLSQTYQNDINTLFGYSNLEDIQSAIRSYHLNFREEINGNNITFTPGGYNTNGKTLNNSLYSNFILTNMKFHSEEKIHFNNHIHFYSVCAYRDNELITSASNGYNLDYYIIPENIDTLKITVLASEVFDLNNVVLIFDKTNQIIQNCLKNNEYEKAKLIQFIQLYESYIISLSAPIDELQTSLDQLRISLNGQNNLLPKITFYLKQSYKIGDNYYNILDILNKDEILFQYKNSENKIIKNIISNINSYDQLLNEYENILKDLNKKILTDQLVEVEISTIKILKDYLKDDYLKLVNYQKAYEQQIKKLTEEISVYEADIEVINNIITELQTSTRGYEKVDISNELILTFIRDFKNNLEEKKKEYLSNVLNKIQQNSKILDINIINFSNYTADEILEFLLDDYNSLANNTIQNLMENVAEEPISIKELELQALEKIDAIYSSYLAKKQNYTEEKNTYIKLIDDIVTIIAALKNNLVELRNRQRSIEKLLQRFLDEREYYLGTQLQTGEGISLINKIANTPFIQYNLNSILIYLDWVNEIVNEINRQIGEIYKNMSNSTEYIKKLKVLIDSYELESFKYLHYYDSLEEDLQGGYDEYNGMDKKYIQYQNYNLYDYKDILFLSNKINDFKDQLKSIDPLIYEEAYNNIQQELQNDLLLKDNNTITVGIFIAEKNNQHIPYLAEVDDSYDSYYPIPKWIGIEQEQPDHFTCNFNSEMHASPPKNNNDWIRKENGKQELRTLSSDFPFDEAYKYTIYTGNDIEHLQIYEPKEDEWQDLLNEGKLKWLTDPEIIKVTIPIYTILYNNLNFIGDFTNYNTLDPRTNIIYKHVPIGTVFNDKKQYFIKENNEYLNYNYSSNSLKEVENNNIYTPMIECIEPDSYYVFWNKLLGLIIHDYDEDTGLENGSLYSLIYYEQIMRDSLIEYLKIVTRYELFMEKNRTLDSFQEFQKKVKELSDMELELSNCQNSLKECQTILNTWDASEDKNDTIEKEQLKEIIQSLKEKEEKILKKIDDLALYISIIFKDIIKEIQNYSTLINKSLQNYNTNMEILENDYDYYKEKVEHYINLLFSSQRDNMALTDNIKIRTSLPLEYQDYYDLGISYNINIYKNIMSLLNQSIDFGNVIDKIEEYNYLVNINYNIFDLITDTNINYTDQINKIFVNKLIPPNDEEYYNIPITQNKLNKISFTNFAPNDSIIIRTLDKDNNLQQQEYTINIFETLNLNNISINTLSIRLRSHVDIKRYKRIIVYTYDTNENEDYYTFNSLGELVLYKYTTSTNWTKDIINKQIYYCNNKTLLDIAKKNLIQVSKDEDFNNLIYYYTKINDNFIITNINEANWDYYKNNFIVYRQEYNNGLKGILYELAYSPLGNYLSNIISEYNNLLQLYSSLLDQQYNSNQMQNELLNSLNNIILKMKELEWALNYENDYLNEEEYFNNIRLALAEYLESLTNNYIEHVEKRFGVVL